ncbi:MAG TPA: hypothetical protein DEQ02_01570, partial [Ruminococcaceae bacterium]|nr:hypothetical protein [Oscillospiraceae bacterium]
MTANSLKRPAGLAARLKRELKKLRAAYAGALRTQEGGTYEWLRDNYYLLDREGRSALKELRRTLPVSQEGEMPQVYLLCEKIAAVKTDSLEKTIRAKIGEYERPLATRELESLVLMLRAAFIHFAYTAIDKRGEDSAEIIGRSVTGLRALDSVDLDGIIETFSLIEKIFSEDPAGVYAGMDDKTRALYRRTCARIAQDESMDERDVAENILRHAEQAQDLRERHVGYYLFEEGGAHTLKKTRGHVFLSLRFLLPLAAAVSAAIWLGHWWLAFLIYLPFFEILRPITEYFAAKGVEPNLLPRMDIGDSIPACAKTIAVISALIPSADRAEKMGEKLTQLLLKNHHGDIKFCLLCDLKQASSPKKPEDGASVRALTRVVEKLNQSYDNKFLLLVRPRVKIETQNAYAGYERKRGAIGQLVQFIKGEDIRFLKKCGDLDFLREARYIIALDSDTELLMNAASGLVAAALHPLNTPEVDEKTGVVKRGYGIITPRVGTNLKSAGRTVFSRIMAGAGGITAYDTLAGDLYQDLFGQSIFAGKGLIDVDAFYKCMIHAFPDERVLSHDILEGAYLRTAFMSDIEVTDGCPPNAVSFMGRLHRWVRGDWQNLRWLFSKIPGPSGGKRQNPIGEIAKYMIADNLRRSLTAPVALVCVLVSFLIMDSAPYLAVTALLSAMAAPLFSSLHSLFSGGIQMLANRYYSRVMPAAMSAAAQALVLASMLFYTAFQQADAIIRALYRQFVSKKNLLEWTTAADLERRPNSFLGVIRACILPVIAGVLLMPVNSSFIKLAAVFAIVSPLVIYLTGRTSDGRQPQLSAEERERLKSYAAAMWRYYDELAGRGDHYLPPDNMQESPVHAVAHRTSPTNIGLMMLCVLAARDCGFIDTQTMVRRITQTLGSVEKLEKWNGNLLNWYDTKTLKPLTPRFVSTVDSGNFACCLIALCEGLREYRGEGEDIDPLCERLSVLAEETDLRPFYNERRKLFHIGYDLEEEKLSTSFYDLLMSEARMTSYFAVANRQVPKKHWGALVRTLAKEGTYSGPVSWTGTMFEYFMPHLLLPVYEDSLGFEALRFCVYCQRRRAKAKNAPFGCSESGFYAFDSEFNYQYKAHGIQRIGLKRRLNDEYVVSPYSSFLILPFLPHTALKNLRRLEKLGMTGRMCFYEAADYTKSRVGAGGYAIIKSYMAHHVGMSLIASVNALY